jgi:hypothetical protein
MKEFAEDSSLDKGYGSRIEETLTVIEAIIK